MLLRTDLDIYTYDRTGLFIMVPYITLKKGVLHDSYYGILLHAVQIRRKMFFVFFVGDIIIYYYNFILMHSYCHSSTKCSTTATLQTELFNRKKCNLHSTLETQISLIIARFQKGPQFVWCAVVKIIIFPAVQHKLLFLGPLFRHLVKPGSPAIFRSAAS